VGYPLRYQVGESRVVASVEQRYFTDWYPFRLARVGAAVFTNAGRVWGENPLGSDNRGWLVDVGVGLRFALTRLTSKVVHLDVAFPLNGDDSIDDVQILLEARKSF
jgi:outer membrane translocation and assembly module TamA